MNESKNLRIHEVKDPKNQLSFTGNYGYLNKSEQIDSGHAIKSKKKFINRRKILLPHQ